MGPEHLWIERLDSPVDWMAERGGSNDILDQNFAANARTPPPGAARLYSPFQCDNLLGMTIRLFSKSFGSGDDHGQL